LIKIRLNGLCLVAQSDIFMNRLVEFVAVVSVACLYSCSFNNGRDGAGPAAGVLWEVDNLQSIGGRETTVLGSPEVIETGSGRAIRFAGTRDGLIVDAMPLAGARNFTLEIIFRPDADGLKEQRFLHLQENGSENRVLIETRLTGDGLWYLDTYIQTAKGGKALIEPANTHQTGKWYNATLVYDGRRMRHYVNGVQEMSADLPFSPLADGKVSIGVRMNRVFWFKGAIRKVRFTPMVLGADQFLWP